MCGFKRSDSRLLSSTLYVLASLSTSTRMRPQTMPSEVPTVRTFVRTVDVDVMVQEKRTRLPVSGLTQDAFQILDNGAPQRINYFSYRQRSRPLALMLVIDVDIPYYRPEFYSEVLAAALRSSLSRLKPDDAVGVMVQSTLRHDELATPEGYVLLQPLTTDREQVVAALEKLAIWVRTRPADFGIPGFPKNDAALQTVASLLAATEASQRSSQSSRTVVVYIGPNIFGTDHVMSFDHGMKQLADSGATVFGVDTGGKGLEYAISKAATISTPMMNPITRTRAIEHASRVTGGEIVEVVGSDYGAALSRVLGDLEARYSLGFVPRVIDGKQHRIEVRVTPPGATGRADKLIVHARQGYLASDVPPMLPTDSDRKHP